jgi:RNA polymerase sigma-70 factor (ECF subfamily)
MASDADDALVSRARRGEREAFGQLVARHQHAMLAIARAYFASEADAQDAVQDAFVKAFQALDQLAEGRRFAAWMARITVNACLETLRTSKEKISLSVFATTVELRPRVGDVPFTPATLASHHEHADLLRAAVGRLAEAQRVPLLLRYLEDMSYEQIAAYLDVPASTVRGRLYKAKQALRRMLTALDAAPG